MERVLYAPRALPPLPPDVSQDPGPYAAWARDRAISEGKDVLIIDTSGPMLDQSAVAELAQPFTRLGQDRTRSHNGHGLGLSIVAAVAAAHDGKIALHARAEGGLRVQITLGSATAQLPATIK